MLTWSFGWTPSPASAAITSFAFVFELVPDPVWKTSIGNWSSNSPAAMRSPAAAMRSAMSASRSPSSAFTRAAAALMRPSQRATGSRDRLAGDGEVRDCLVASPRPRASALSSRSRGESSRVQVCQFRANAPQSLFPEPVPGKAPKALKSFHRS